MKALVYEGPGDVKWQDVPDPKIQQSRDVIVQVDTTTICGSDLHIVWGHMPTVQPGRVLGHEAVGTIVEAGRSVKDFAVGDKVLVPAISSCGTCPFCKMGMPSHCRGAGGIGCIFGSAIDGTQAEYVRVPFARTSLHKVPQGLDDDDVLFLADIFPTGYEMGVVAGKVRPGNTVAVIGAGPVGLAAIVTAQLLGPSQIIAVGRKQPRLDWAMRLGATHALSSTDPQWREQIMELTDGLGADVVIEAVGSPSTIEAAFAIVRPGGHVANAGVHGRPFTMEIESLWIQNITFTTGLVDCTSIPTLMKLVQNGVLNPSVFGTHYFSLDQFEKAYEVFENSSQYNALKPVLQR